MAMSTVPKFLTLKWNISRNIWRIAVGDGSLFCILQALSFGLNFFRLEFPFKKNATFLLFDRDFEPRTPSSISYHGNEESISQFQKIL